MQPDSVLNAIEGHFYIKVLVANSIIIRFQGAPDVTMGSLRESESWYFDEVQVRNRTRSYLIHSFRIEELQALFAKVRRNLNTFCKLLTRPISSGL